MLTDSEKRWLKLRKLYEGVNYYSYYSCMHCPEYNIGRWHGYKRPCNEACLSNGCPFIDIGSSQAVFDYIEAAEFEERVAAKLAKWDNEYHKGDHLCPYGDDDFDSYIPLCHCINFCQYHPRLGCIAAKLAWARLEVEEEMDAD